MLYYFHVPDDQYVLAYVFNTADQHIRACNKYTHNGTVPHWANLVPHNARFQECDLYAHSNFFSMLILVFENNVILSCWFRSC